jgi:hypothetical protein
MTEEVHVVPQTETAVRWLRTNFEELRRAFFEVHRSGQRDIDAEHPHDLSLVEPEREWLDPGDLPVYVYIPAHGSAQHQSQTLNDVRRVMKALGANLSEFVFE